MPIGFGYDPRDFRIEFDLDVVGLVATEYRPCIAEVFPEIECSGTWASASRILNVINQATRYVLIVSESVVRAIKYHALLTNARRTGFR